MVLHNNLVKIASYNVNGLLHPIKRSKILSKMKKDDIMVVFLQETHLTEKEHDKLRRNGYTQVYNSSYKSGHRRGVAILISSKISFQKLSVISDKEGRYLMVKGRMEGELVCFLNIYAPPGSDWVFYRQLFDLMTLEVEGILIAGGDLNQRLNPELDTSTQTPTSSGTNKKIRDMMLELGVIDIWRELNPSIKDYTYYSSPHNTYSRIDYFMTYTKDRHRVENCEIGLRDLSDHSPLYLSLILTPEKKTTVWRLNVNILKGRTKEELKLEIQRYFKENDNDEVSPPVLWDACKAVIRGKIIAMTSFLKKQKQKTLEALQKNLKELEKSHKQTPDENILQEIKKTKAEINVIYSEEIQKKMLFTKQKYYEIGSKSTKLLAYKLKKQQAKNSIYGVRDPHNGTVRYKTEDIQKCFELYYTKLYDQSASSNEADINSFLTKLVLPKVSDDQNKQLISEITATEINSAISKLKTNKSPGADGYPSEWYKTYKEILIPVLQRTFNWVLKKGEIPNSWRDAIISVIPKEGKDEMECTNYRPISVLNQDYRLFTAIMARRLEKILPGIIQFDQTGFIKGRQTQDNIRRTLHVMQHINDKQIESVIMGMDAEKAFDSVRWEFLYKVLEKFNFHRTFIRTMQALYTTPSARIKVNGSLSSSISLKRGCRQGCSASPLIFGIFLEPLSQAIKQNEKIEGIEMEGGLQKLALFADDVLIYLSNPNSSLPELMTLFGEFGRLSGYKINVQKTQVLSYNYDPSEGVKRLYNLNWDQQSIKYLGVHLTKDLGQLKIANYAPLMTKIREDIDRWNLIPFMTIASRVEVIKINVLPRILYLFQNLPVEISNKEFIEWDKFISRYIWEGRRPRIKYRTLQLPKAKGGLALPCLKSYFQAAQIKILLNLCNPAYVSKWKEIEVNMIRGVPLQAIIGDEKLGKLYTKNINPWLEVSLNVWFETVLNYGLSQQCKLLRWIGFDVDFIPNKTDGRFKNWKQGPHMFWQLVKNKQCKSFQEIQDQWGLLSQDFYRFLQLRHYLEFNIKKENFDIDSPMIKLFILSYQSKLNRKVISKIYIDLEELKKNNTDYIQNKWEIEANIKMTAEDWDNINQNIWRTTCSLMWREHGWKNIVRFFRTPAQTKYRDTNCWRQCGETVANHLHVFWGCPILESYWKELKICMDTVLKTNLPFNFETFFFGKIEGANTNLNMKMLRIMLLAGKKGITRNWLKTEAPKKETWVDVMHDIYVMEKLTYTLRLETDKFERIWTGWLNFVLTFRKDFV